MSVLEAGAGRAVLCLHSSLGSSRQWLALMETMAPHARVVAADLHGHGTSPAWHGARRLRLDDEIARLEPVLDRLGDDFDLVGHSYGAAVAVRLAMRHRARVRTLSIYEPVLFSMLRLDEAGAPPAEEIRRLRRDLEQAMSRGRAERAAQRFIEYWSGAGAWRSASDERRRRYAVGMPAVMENFATADSDRSGPRHYRSLRVPTLLLHGTRSPASTLRIVELLSALLPNVEVDAVSGAGHMGPITHPDAVNRRIRDFLLARRTLRAVA